ncbi:MAG TPA: acetylxylan esterase [bacterium]|nr:acetylxylan esterase [bacterium]HOL66219.1 acetylxylan esterase [bacterium]HPP12724.1 acetylxylan esterase [bacterium]
MKMVNWQERQRQKLYRLLGQLPARTRRISARVVEKVDFDGYCLEKLVLDLNGVEPVPAYFARPANLSGKIPAVLYNHAHGGNYELGKDELIYGRKGLQSPPYGKVLTQAGYAVLCLDDWCFGERRGRSESEVFKEMLWKGQVLWGMMVYDHLRAIDYLVSRAEVEKKCLATMGISMGSTMAWWVAALDVRIKVCVDLCCLTDYQALIERRGLDGHGIYYYVPSLLKHFTTARINALIAPRYHLSLAGEYDYLTPPAGLDRIDAELKKVYASFRAHDAWQLKRYPIGHFETAAMRQEVVEFLRCHLR